MVKWTPQLDVALLFAITECCGAKFAGTEFWDSVIERMGPAFQKRGLEQRFLALRKRRDEILAVARGEDGEGLTPATPRKRKEPAGGDGTPVKTPRKRVAKKKKVEEGNGQGEVVAFADADEEEVTVKEEMI